MDDPPHGPVRVVGGGHELAHELALPHLLRPRLGPVADEPLREHRDHLGPGDGLFEGGAVEPGVRQHPGLREPARHHLGVPRYEHELVSGLQDPGHEAATDVPTGADDEDAHRPEYVRSDPSRAGRVARDSRALREPGGIWW